MSTEKEKDKKERKEKKDKKEKKELLSPDRWANPEKEGALTKRGDVIQNWKLRYFRLKAPYLYYFEDVKASKPKGVINLQGATVDVAHRAAKSEHKLCFELHVPSEKRTYLVNANSEEELSSWVSALQFATGSPPGVRQAASSNEHLQVSGAVPKSPSSSSASEAISDTPTRPKANSVLLTSNQQLAAEQAARDKFLHISTTTNGNAVINTSVGPTGETIVSRVEAQAPPTKQVAIAEPPREAPAPAAPEISEKPGLLPTPTMASWLTKNTLELIKNSISEEFLVLVRLAIGAEWKSGDDSDR